MPGLGRSRADARRPHSRGGRQGRRPRELVPRRRRSNEEIEERSHARWPSGFRAGPCARLRSRACTKQATFPGEERSDSDWRGRRPGGPRHGIGAVVVLPGPPERAAATLATRPRDRRGPGRARPRPAPERRVLRFYGVPESAIARSLAAAGGDGGGVDVTICAGTSSSTSICSSSRAPSGPTRSSGSSSTPLGRSSSRGASVGRGARARAAPRPGLTLATAESCTGGLVGARLTDVPGSSDVFLGGAIVYSDQGSRRTRRFRGDPGRARCRVGRGGGRARAGRAAAASRRCRRRRDGNRRAWGGTAGSRSVSFLHAAGPRANATCASTSPAIARRFGAARPSRRCTSCGVC